MSNAPGLAIVLKDAHGRIMHTNPFNVRISGFVADIAQDVGFYDHAHFIHSFRRATGQTPADYRRQHRN